MNRNFQHPNQKKSSSSWKFFLLAVILIIIPWVLYIQYHPNFVQNAIKASVGSTSATTSTATTTTNAAISISSVIPTTSTSAVVDKVSKGYSKSGKYTLTKQPVLGAEPTNGAVPLFGVQHKGTDAIMALACNYPTIYYKRFVGSLRKFGYNEDIVLAVSPVEKMKSGVEAYLKETGVVAYGFDVDCAGTDNCKLKDDFLGYPDPRPHRTFANIRYALYEYWMRHYDESSYILILDFRDTFFQANPFQNFGPYAQRQLPAKYELHMYAENYKVKNIGICVFNSNWIKTCFGKPALEALKSQAVICSGSTLGSFPAVHHYVRTMLQSMDSVKCWLKGIESDQGYQNYLFYNGHFNTQFGNATLFHQGYGVVNTIGAMNGYRVPAAQKGPLDTFWKIRDQEGFVLNYDGSRSACVHQWDRWHDELVQFIDTKTF